MKILLTALTAVFFMFAVNGCSDDTECDAGTPEVGADVSVELDVSEDATASDEDVSTSESDVESDTTSTEDDVVDSDTAAVEAPESTDATNDSGDDAADQGESE